MAAYPAGEASIEASEQAITDFLVDFAANCVAEKVEPEEVNSDGCKRPAPHTLPLPRGSGSDHTLRGSRFREALSALGTTDA